MVVDVELNIPPKFFESAKLDNEFESVSERIAKQFITSILKIPSVKRGNAELKEPDYVSEGLGFEVTFAVNEALIPQLKGVKPIDPSMWNMEEELIDSVLDAVERKAKKTYSQGWGNKNIFIKTGGKWCEKLKYYSLFSHIISDFFAYCKACVHTSDVLLDSGGVLDVNACVCVHVCKNHACFGKGDKTCHVLLNSGGVFDVNL